MSRVTPEVEAAGFRRPESVHCLHDATVAASHAGYGVREVATDGSTRLIGSPDSPEELFLPNGIAPIDGGYLIADLGALGGIWRAQSESRDVWLSEVAGRTLPPANFVLVEESGRVWITVSTHRVPRHEAYKRGVADGFIVLVDENGPRVVAERLAYANELAVVDDTLYVNETLRHCMTAFGIRPDGSLGPRRIAATYQPTDFPDGIAVDVNGHLWTACIVSNRIYCTDTDSLDTELIHDFAVPEWTGEVQSALNSGGLSRHHFDSAPPGPVKSISSIAFREPGSGYLLCGSLIDDRILRLPVTVDGVAQFAPPILLWEP